MSPALAGGFFTTSATWEAPLPPPAGPKGWKEMAATPLGIPAPLKQPWCSLRRTLEPLETEGVPTCRGNSLGKSLETWHT